jgi:hypothetical protein
MVDALTRFQGGDDAVFLRQAFGGDDEGDVAADDLPRRIAENPLRRAVPGGDVAVEILADDGVIRRFNDGAEIGADAFSLLEAGDVAQDFRGADQRAGIVLDGRRGDGDIQHPPVFGAAHGFETAYAFFLPQELARFVFLMQAVWRDEEADMLAHRFRARVAKDTFRRRAPGGDVAVEILADDRVIRCGDDGA